MKVKSSYPKPKLSAIRAPEAGLLSGAGAVDAAEPGCAGAGGSDEQVEMKSQRKPGRKRLNTNRSNQERLMNMAEARREIVAALKCHRAAMKRAADKPRWREKKPPEFPPFSPTTHHVSPEQYFSVDSWPISPVPSIPCIHEIPNLELPTRALGLNLNVDSFECLGTAGSNPSSTLSSLSPPLQVVAAAEENSGTNQDTQMLGSKELEEMKTIGKQHAMEWDDIMNLVNCAWWFKFLKSMEIEDHKSDDLVSSLFDQVMEFPAWLNANESFSHSFYEDCFTDPALPCMEIEDIDSDWLA